MNKKELLKIAENIIENKHTEFLGIKPIVKKESISVKQYAKILKKDFEEKHEIVYSFTYVKSGGFKKILRFSINNKGEILKTSISK